LVENVKIGIGSGIVVIGSFDWSIFDFGVFPLVHNPNSIDKPLLEAHIDQALSLLHSSTSQLAVSV
jgi:hypothetical protein